MKRDIEPFQRKLHVLVTFEQLLRAKDQGYGISEYIDQLEKRIAVMSEQIRKLNDTMEIQASHIARQEVKLDHGDHH